MNVRNLIRDAFLIVLGSAFAVGIDCLRPLWYRRRWHYRSRNGLSCHSGTAGIELPIGAQTIAMNIILILFVVRGGNRSYLIRSIVGFMISSLFIDLLAPFLPVLGKHDLILGAWGGLFVVSVWAWYFAPEPTPVVRTLLPKRLPRGFLCPGTSVIIVDGDCHCGCAGVFLRERPHSTLAMFITEKYLTT